MTSLCSYFSFLIAVLRAFEKVVMCSTRQTTSLIHYGSSIYLSPLQIKYNLFIMQFWQTVVVSVVHSSTFEPYACVYFVSLCVCALVNIYLGNCI